MCCCLSANKQHIWWLILHTQHSICVCRFLLLSGVKMWLVKNDWVTGWQVSRAEPHRFITGWQSGALQGTVVGGNASGLLINILSPPFSYSQAWHSGWPGPPPGGKLSSWTISQHLVARKTVCLFSHKENEKRWHQLTFIWIWYAVCSLVDCLSLFVCANECFTKFYIFLTVK